MIYQTKCSKLVFSFSPSERITSLFFLFRLLFLSQFFFVFVFKETLSLPARLCLWLSEKTERLNSATRPLICDWVWEMREPSVATCRELSARFSLPQRPTAGPRPQHEKHTCQWPPGAVAVDTDVKRNSTDATHTHTVSEYTWGLNPSFLVF